MSGVPASEVIEKMPLRLVYAYEHCYYRKHGWLCSPVTNKTLAELTLEDVAANSHK